MKITVSIIALWLCVPALGQTSLADYRAAVADYSWQLKIAASKSDAAAETAGQARTGYLPRLAMDGSFTATVRHFDGVERWTFSLLPQLVQTVYGGGAVRAARRRSVSTSSPMKPNSMAASGTGESLKLSLIHI